MPASLNPERFSTLLAAKFRRLITVAQLGAVNTLAINLNKADFTLDTITGSLLKVAAESKARISTDKISKVGAVIPQADSVFRKKKKTEIEQMEEKAKELELRVRIKEAESKLN